jgi:nucleotide-binding universal stress UspA family protein
MYKRILVPIDGSRTSTLGLQEAIRLAKGSKAKLRLIHVVDESVALQDSAYTFGTEDMLSILKKGGEQSLKRAQELVSKHGIKPESKLVESFTGSVADIIVGDAKKWRADLIVMGTHGRRGFSHMMLGSDAEMVVRSSPAPVLLVRGSTPAKRKTAK